LIEVTANNYLILSLTGCDVIEHQFAKLIDLDAESLLSGGK